MRCRLPRPQRARGAQVLQRLRARIVLGPISGAFASCRDPQAALKRRYCSDGATRDGPVVLRVRRTERDAKRVLAARAQDSKTAGRVARLDAAACESEQNHVLILVRNKCLSRLDKDNMG